MTVEPKLVATELSIEKRTLFNQLLQEAGIDSSSSSIIPRRENLGKVLLSFAQEQLWFLDQLEPGSATYNIPAAFRLTGHLNIPALEQSLNKIVHRHKTLRTTFEAEDGRPVQVIAPAPTTPLLTVKDLRHFSEAEREVEAKRLTAKEARSPFDLARGPLLRATLLQLGDEEHVLLLTIHHIVFDEWSFTVFNREMSVLYEAFSAGKPSPLPELSIQYADFAQWSRGEALQTQLAYWKKQLDNLPVLELPTDRLRPVAQTFRGRLHSFVLPPKLSEAIKALSRREGVTLSMMLLAAFKVLLYRYTGQADIAVGFPITGRNRSELEGLIGFFLNTLVLRTDLSGNPSCRELWGRVRQVSLDAYTHRDLPFERLVGELQPERDLSHTPLFQVMFVLQDAGVEALTLPGLTASPLETHSGTAKFDLTLFMKETRQGLQGTFEYNTDLFDAATIERMVRHLRMLLERSGCANQQRRQQSSNDCFRANDLFVPF